jgi:ribokinase
MDRPTPRITVLGSINMDLVIRCAHLPQRGETIIAESVAEVSGGKGANQAVAAARLGAEVTMIGSVGDDAFADRLLENLEREQVDVSHVSRRSLCASGLAIVAVERSGENSIMVVPGANGTLSLEDVRKSADIIRQSDALLLQLEVPVETVIAAMQFARESGTRVIVNPAPVPQPFPKELLDADLICPNESEAEFILGVDIGSIEAGQRAAAELVSRGARYAIITLGGRGAIVCDGRSTEWVQPFPIEPVDTTAAGDAFAGALAVRWSAETGLIEAARFACAAGAVAATRAGAQPGMPTVSDVEQLMNSRGKNEAT